jgi:MFS family permease
MPTITDSTDPAENPPSIEQPTPASFRRVLKNRDFLLLWLAQLISLTILNAANYGVIVLVNDTTHSVFLSGLAIIAFTVPAIPFSLIAGVVVDRLNKRLVLWVSNVLRALTMLLVVVSLLYDRTSMWPLFVLTFAASTIGQFFIPAEGASIPLLVGERELMPALALFNISLTISQAVGFLLLGSLVATLFPPFTLHLLGLTLNVHSIDMLFVIVTVLYLACAVLILCIPVSAFDETHIRKYQRQETHIEASTALKALWDDMIEGYLIVRQDRLLFFSVIQLSVVGIIMLLIGELAGTFVQQILHRSAANMSIILAPAAIGLVGASTLMPRITERVGKIHLTTIGFITLAVGFIALPTAEWIVQHLNPAHGSESPLFFGIIVVLVLVLGIAMACVNIPTQTIMQERAPESGRARVLSLQFMIYNTGSIPVLLFAGVFAQYLGFNQLIFLISASLLLFCWWGVRYIHGYEGKPSSERDAS